MATSAPNPAPAPAPAPKSNSVTGVLGSLLGISNLIVLGIQVGDEIVPLIKGAISDIQSALEGGTITYTLALQTAASELVGDAMIDQADLVLINAELARQGLPLLMIPADDADTAAQIEDSGPQTT